MIRSLLSSWLLLFCLAAPAGATLVKQLELVPDGSAFPPGDRLDLTVYFFPGEEEVVVEVRPFATLQGQRGATPLAMALLNKDGAIVSVTIKRQKSSLAAKEQIVVP